ncbi:MAG: DUF1127 domain-containing protein [Pseudomonadota bacterium]
MTVFDTSRTASAAASRGIVQKLFALIAAWNDARMTRKALSHLTARELNDIGLTRADIDNISGS